MQMIHPAQEQEQQLHQNGTRSRKQMEEGNSVSHPSLDSYFQSTNESDKWRMYGKARRRQILEDDRQRGGTKFNLNASCSVERYYEVASRVRFLCFPV